MQTNRTAKNEIKSAANCHLIVMKTLASAQNLPMDEHSHYMDVQQQIEHEFDVEGEIRVPVEPFIDWSESFVGFVENALDINEGLLERGLPS